MESQARSGLQPYVVAVGTVAAVVGVKLLLNPLIGRDTPFLLLFAPVMAAAWRGGLSGGLFATGLSALAATWFFLPPQGVFSIGPQQAIQIAVFLVEGWLIASLCATVQQGRAALEGRVHERTQDLSEANQALQAEIVERKRVEAALQQSAAEINDLYNQAPCGYHSLDAEGVFTRINDTELAWLGYERDELVGKRRFADLLTPGSLATFHENFPRFKEQGAVWGLEFEMIRRNGSAFWVLLNAAALRDAAGGYVESRSTLFDISARKQSEERLAQLGAIIDSSEDAIIGKTVEGVITSWNRGAERLYGYAAEEVVGRHISILVLPERPDEAPYILGRIRRGEPVEHYETVRVRKDGSKVHVSLTISPIRNSAGEITGASTIGRDITDRVLAGEKLQSYARELERSNLELQQFASVASHDLQEPLRKIRAYGDVLREDCYDALGAEGRDSLDLIQNAAARMQALIDGLLLLSRVSTKAQPFSRVDLEEVAQEVLADLELRLQETGGRVEIGELPIVEADPTQVRQLLQNLIANALKFRREDEPPRVRIHSERLNGQDDSVARGPGSEEVWRIMVQDNGIGFEEKYLDRIFNPFQRLHSRTAYEGTGIGLAICRRIVERHGGTITARSAPGEGATFIVTLPARRPQERTHE